MTRSTRWAAISTACAGCYRRGRRRALCTRRLPGNPLRSLCTAHEQNRGPGFRMPNTCVNPARRSRVTPALSDRRQGRERSRGAPARAGRAPSRPDGGAGSGRARDPRSASHHTGLCPDPQALPFTVGYRLAALHGIGAFAAARRKYPLTMCDITDPAR